MSQNGGCSGRNLLTARWLEGWDQGASQVGFSRGLLPPQHTDGCLLAVSSRGIVSACALHLPCCCCCSVPKSCPALCNPIHCSMPGFPFTSLCPSLSPRVAQIQVSWVSGTAVSLDQNLLYQTHFSSTTSMAAHISTQSMGSQRVRYNWATKHASLKILSPNTVLLWDTEVWTLRTSTEGFWIDTTQSTESGHQRELAQVGGQVPAGAGLVKCHSHGRNWNDPVQTSSELVTTDLICKTGSGVHVPPISLSQEVP